jgi:signal transduction histidine kinase
LTSNLVRSGQEQPFADPTQVVDLVMVARQACEWAQTAADVKGIIIQEEIASPRTLMVCGDADALLSVFGNLLSNAIRYSPEGGRVVVRHGMSDGDVWVEVEDSGMGMSQEVQERIFDKFYRGPDARAIEAQGLGLGLTLVSQAVSAHGGTVTVASSPGCGSTFRVMLPEAPTTGCAIHHQEGEDG